MRFRGKLCKLLFGGILAVASFGGVYMPPEKVEDLLHSMNQPKIAHKLPDDSENGDDLIRKLLSGD